MTGRYVCCDERRRALLADPAAPAGISGIDYLEVQQGNPVSNPTVITIVLVKPLTLPAAQLTRDNIRITGGVRFPAPRVDTVQALPGAGTVASYQVTIPGGQQTDFSAYRLEVVAGPGQSNPPAFLDPHLSSVEFSFKVDCGSELDCAEPPRPTGAGPVDDPEFDYLARDWEGFRRLMLDRLAVLVPGFREDDAVDLTTTVIEALAYRLDQQSYRLDWTTTEAFLDTARSRTSLVRHARLVDYVPAEGASARTFVSLGFRASAAFPDGQLLPAHTPVLPRQADLPTVVTAPEYATWLRATPDLPVAFETLAPIGLWQWRSRIALHTWGDEECSVPRGAIGLTLVDDSGGGPGALRPGDLLLVEEIASPETGEGADADPQHRFVVRLTSAIPTHDVLFPALSLVEVGWDEADALPFDLVVSRRVQGPSGPPVRVVCGAVRGNVVLAEHGVTLPPVTSLGLTPASTADLSPRLDPPAPEPGSRWEPRVRASGPLARVSPHGPADLPRLTATVLLAATGGPPAIRLRDAFSTWTARTDLLATGAFGRDFVVETDATGAPTLRFGDGIHGLGPTVRAPLGVEGRFGCGTGGNLGAGALGHVVVPAALGQLPVQDVTNPVPGRGGAAPESAAVVRAVAPEAFRHPQRAVTADDYAVAAREHPDVSNAMAVARWTGAWQTVVVHVDRAGGRPVDAAFRTSLMAHLEAYRLAGFDVAVKAAKLVPLDVELSICALPGEIRGVVGQRVRAALTPVAPDGGFGFFHPDRFTFGTPLYLSALIAAVMAVPGVQSVTPVVFQRFARLSQGELGLGVIKPDATEVLELRDDPNFPERGRLRITMGGGR